MRINTLQCLLTTYWPTVFPTLGYVAPDVLKVINALIMCRTHMLGAHRYTCDRAECGTSLLAYNSCRNRHCPLCQALARAQWLKQRLTQLLPIHYFHIVFTLPSELRPLVRENKRVLYGLMFKAASQTILTLCADRKRLNGQAGLILMLHTWAQRLTFHPHLHGIIPGGVLSHDGTAFRPASKKFFLPVKVVAKMFRGKLLAMFREAHAQGKLVCSKNEFHRIVTQAYATDWHVYLEPSFKRPIRVLKYLAAYTNRVAITDQRILSIDDGTVRFRWVDRTCCPVQYKTAELEPREFIARFLLHILPKGFVKIRYYGILSNRGGSAALPVCLWALSRRAPKRAARLHEDVSRELGNMTDSTADRMCPLCGLGRLHITQWIAPAFIVNQVGSND